MKIRNSILFLILVLADACVDRLFFEPPLNKDEFVIEGFISDRPGPYTVRLFKSDNIESNILSPIPIEAKKVTIFDDEGNTEELTSIGNGSFETKPNGIRGTVGRKYALRIELFDGEIFESIPDKMMPVGEVENIYFEFDRFRPLQGPTQYGFKVFMDSRDDGVVRWKFTGTFIVETFPEFRQWPRGGCPGVRTDPPPCSGYRIVDGNLTRIGDCTCCYCWAIDSESKPHLSDDLIRTSGVFKKIEIGYVPFDVWRFHFWKYMIRVEQMSLSQNAFEFWKIIKDQKEGSTSLFQPAFGRIRTNFVSKNSNKKVIGFFYSTSITQKVTFIKGSDAPIPVPEFDVPGKEVCQFWDECDVVWHNASRTPPPEWE